jgi:uncharacterized membrane protein
MNTYLLVKWIHVLSSVVMVGTGLGSAYYMFFANRSKSLAAQAVVTQLVVRADWWFTTPNVIIQPLSGLWLAHLAGFPLSTPWLALSLALYGLAGACWLPVVWLQIRMAAMAQDALSTGQALPPLYWRYARRWEMLGYPAFAAMVVVFFLMVNKPSLFLEVLCKLHATPNSTNSPPNWATALMARSKSAVTMFLPFGTSRSCTSAVKFRAWVTRW